jgi:hypothetical protein
MKKIFKFAFFAVLFAQAALISHQSLQQKSDAVETILGCRHCE